MAREERLHRVQRALAGALVAEQAPVVVRHQRDAEQLERQLFRVGARRELALLDGLPRRAVEGIDPAALAGGERVAHQAGLVVEFRGAADHRAAARQVGRFGPVEPAQEEGAEPGQAARLGQRGLDDEVDELPLAPFQDRDEQFLARAEMREQARLRQSRRLGERADRQAFKTVLADDAEPGVEDRGARPLALGQGGAHGKGPGVHGPQK